MLHALPRLSSSALVATLAYGLATPAWAYAIVFYGHALAACCLLIALALATRIRAARTPRDEIWTGLGIGFAAGWAVVTEYPVVVAAVVIAAFALWEASRGGVARSVRVGVPLTISALTCASVLMVYHYEAFGSPFRVGYAFYDDPRTMKTGLLGIAVPQWQILSELLFGWYRGLAPTAPILFLAPLGFWRFYQGPTTRSLGIALAAAAGLGMLMMSGDVHWEGGWTYGPRYLAFVMGFLALAIAPVWHAGSRVTRALIIILLVAGVASSIVAVSTTVQPQGDQLHPMRDVLWPAFKNGDLSLNTQSILDLRPAESRESPRAAWNVGQKMGLHGLVSLVPLFAIWAAGAAAYAAVGRSRQAIDSHALSGEC